MSCPGTREYRCSAGIPGADPLPGRILRTGVLCTYLYIIAFFCLLLEIIIHLKQIRDRAATRIAARGPAAWKMKPRAVFTCSLPDSLLSGPRANISADYKGDYITHHCDEPVAQLHARPGMTVDELVRAMGKAGAYNGGALARAADICERMLRDPQTTKFFGLAGAMVPAGMGGIVADLIRDGHIDVLVSTGANLTHDTIEAIGCRHFHGTAACNDIELRHDEINRIYDVYLPNEAFEHFEEFMQGVFGELRPGSTISISDLLRHIGMHAKSGILHTAARKGIPVYCPAVQDSMIGLQYWLFSQTNKVTVDAFADMPALLDRCFSVKKAGALLVGGGVPKNFILQSMLMTPNGFDYAVQLTGDRPDLGGLSGATLDEARSWGKITEEAQAVTVYGDATITLPMLIAAVTERMHHG